MIEVEAGFIEQLTRREREVVALLMLRGCTNAEIADVLVVEPSTVKYHLGQLHRKLGVTTRTELVSYAWQHGNCHDGQWWPNE